MNKFELKALREEVLTAICQHDTSAPFITPTQFVDGLIWLRRELLKTMAPFAVRKEYESKSALCRMFQTSMYTVDKVLRASRIQYKMRTNGQRLYKVDDFENALKANNQ
jgi:hypothetical protein